MLLRFWVKTPTMFTSQLLSKIMVVSEGCKVVRVITRLSQPFSWVKTCVLEPAKAGSQVLKFNTVVSMVNTVTVTLSETKAVQAVAELSRMLVIL